MVARKYAIAPSHSSQNLAQYPRSHQVNSDVGKQLDLLKMDGIYCRVGIPPSNDQTFSDKWIPLIFTQKKIAGTHRPVVDTVKP